MSYDASYLNIRKLGLHDIGNNNNIAIFSFSAIYRDIKKKKNLTDYLNSYIWEELIILE